MNPTIRLCSKCPTELSPSNKTGLCVTHSQEAQGEERRKVRLCTDCRRPITKYSKSGMCTECQRGLRTWTKRRQAALIKKVVADLRKQVTASWPTYTVPPFLGKVDLDVMLEIQIPDLHMGKMAWAEETGEANYDAKIAETLYRSAFTALLDRTHAYMPNRIVLIVGSDGLHSDTKQGTTTAGTPLDIDSRYHKNYMTLQRCTVWAAQLAANRAPLVDVYAIPGNHDTLASWHLGNALSLVFQNEPRVTVHNTPKMRQYCEHGKVMLMFTHGNQGKLERYPNLMAADEPEMWGRAHYREAHTGDKHQTKVQEFMGTRVRICPALCPADAWHAEKHFLHQQRAAEAFVWDKNLGLLGTAVYTVPKGK